MSKEKIQNTKNNPETKSQTAKNSSYSKKKKVKKNIINGIAYVQ